MSNRTHRKVILLGDSGVGKTSLFEVYTKGTFPSVHKPTVGVDLGTQSVMEDGRDVTLQIWDCAGQERFQSLGAAFYRGADACILIFDITSLKSFQNLQKWRDQFLSYNAPPKEAEFPFVIIGHKTDLEQRREVFAEDVYQWIQELDGNVFYCEASAKEGRDSLESIFRMTCSMIMGKSAKMVKGKSSKMEGLNDSFSKGEVEKQAGLLAHGNNVPLKSVTVKARVMDILAEVTIEQNYINAEKVPIEAIYMFPLDDSSIVTTFTARMGNTEVAATIAEKEKAFETYEDEISKGNTAFLLKQKRPDIFMCNVGNLPPNSEIIIRITYVTTLSSDMSSRTFVIPTSVAPRYNPPGKASPTAANEWVSTYLYEFNAEISLDMPSPILSVQSLTHSIKQKVNGKTGSVSLSTLLDGKDFVVNIDLKEAPASAGWVEKRSENECAFFLSFLPPVPASQNTEESDIYFLIDRSGSMSGGVMKKAKEALQLLLRSLPVNCSFNIIGFGSNYQSMFPSPVRYNQASLLKASKLVSEMEADLGGTEILHPLQHIFSQPLKSGKGIVFVVTDGQVGNTEQVIELVRKYSKTVRLFSLGIGDMASRALVNGIAQAGKGKSEFVTLSERLEKKIVKQMKCAVQVEFDHVQIDWGHLSNNRAFKMVPEKVSQFFLGERLFVQGLLSEPIDRDIHVTMEAKSSIDGITTSDSITLSSSTARVSSMLHCLAASCLIKSLETERPLSDSSKKQIIMLSKKYNVISSQTSFVGVQQNAESVEQAMETRMIPIVMSPRSGAALEDFSFSFSQRSTDHSYSCQSAPVCISLDAASASERSAGCCGSSSQPCSTGSYKPTRRYSPPPVASSRRDNAVDEFVAPPSQAKQAIVNPVQQSSDNRSKMMKIIQLQDFQGNWKSSPEVMTALDITESKGRKAKPQDLKQDEWVTLLCIQYLHTFFKAQREEYELVVRKAEQWLKDNHVEAFKWRAQVQAVWSTE